MAWGGEGDSVRACACDCASVRAGGEHSCTFVTFVTMPSTTSFLNGLKTIASYGTVNTAMPVPSCRRRPAIASRRREGGRERSGGGGGVEGVSTRVADGCKQRGSVAEPRRGGGEGIGGLGSGGEHSAAEGREAERHAFVHAHTTQTCAHVRMNTSTLSLARADTHRCGCAT